MSLQHSWKSHVSVVSLNGLKILMGAQSQWLAIISARLSAVDLRKEARWMILCESLILTCQFLKEPTCTNNGKIRMKYGEAVSHRWWRFGGQMKATSYCVLCHSRLLADVIVQCALFQCNDVALYFWSYSAQMTEREASERKKVLQPVLRARTASIAGTKVPHTLICHARIT